MPLKDFDAEIIAQYGIQRHNDWGKIARQHLIGQPKCLICGLNVLYNLIQEGSCNVHHKYPLQHCIAVNRPDLELDRRNMFTVCARHFDHHHLLIGHLEDWESYNPHLETTIALVRNLTQVQIRNTIMFCEAVKNRPKPLKEWSEAEKNIFKNHLEEVMPRRS